MSSWIKAGIDHLQFQHRKHEAVRPGGQVHRAATRNITCSEEHLRVVVSIDLGNALRNRTLIAR
jgi:hypothetical protein